MKLKTLTLRVFATLREIKSYFCYLNKYLLTVIIICLIIRLLPYFAPIHSADIAQKQLALQFTDRNGLPLGTILTHDQEHTSIVPLNQVSPQFINAILAAEDGNFYHHGALDLQAIVRAIKDSIEHKKIVSGASTITMQLARMLDNAPRTLSDKLHEIWLSWRLTAGMNKDEILTAYINRLPMGGNIYGVEAAAQIYFSTSASNLNLAQASVLAAIPNNPTYFDPYQHCDRLKQRQKYVLNQMVKDGYISSAEAERIYKEQVVFQSRQQGIIAAPHFLFWLAKQNTPPLTPPRKQGGELESSPTQTTINRPLQQFVEAQVQQVIDSLADNNVHDAAAVVIDNYSGEVLAYVGSPDYFNDVKLGRNDGVQALRQPGSTLKPFVYELALEKGVIKPNSILADVPSHYAIPGAKLYSPTDYTNSFLGPVRVRVALANSLNVPAVKVLEKVSVSTFLSRLHELGFEHLNQSAEYYGLGLTLGSGEVSLWELAKAYLTMARVGKSTPLVTILNNAPKNSPVSSPQNLTPKPTNWQLITDMLSDRYARATAFGVDSVLNLPFPAAVKTGTSSNYRDTWTVGFTTDYTVATWVGNFNGEPMRQVSGVTGAAPLWSRIMLHLHEHQPPTNFTPPHGLIKLPICATTGLKPTPNCNSIVQEYFSPADKIAYQNSADYHLSPVYDQWLRKQPQSNLAANKFRIISPRNGDLFLLYPGAEKQQKLEFKVAGNFDQPIEWRLNGKHLSTQSNNALFWQLQSGNWQLEARTGKMRHQINFQVQLGNVQSTQQGFSVVHPTVSSHVVN
ncbi:penicillin-binding protein 1C [Sphaerospermopsis aphanizomenoides BCCUSP55]|uniref:penicillin-binding protein 1C n=1 Tax=Sphaerospermopsis aphanizomenoides TaxID=459663 RepID=UPI001903E4D6|nr:penicillin-binding protein 1C [Sphaerospermopsis aphanizomenoides]MBK1989506.1 penicillin-binding protein 1C [Sphaerospermopsis aphanizomenoides BCCUSP55]